MMLIKKATPGWRGAGPKIGLVVCRVELFGGFFLPKMIKSRSEKFNLMLFFFFTRNE